jgi:release factor glutamine methyltransferase
MPDLRTLLADASARFDLPRLEIELLLAHVLGRDRAWLFAHADETVDAAQAAAFDAVLARRDSGEPLAYITGRRGFWTLDLEVTPATLIPRPETELLVELALARLPAAAADPLWERLQPRPRGKDDTTDLNTCIGTTVADLGTGSGAVALAIASERPDIAVVATDASAEALAVAQRNATRLGLDHVRFAQGDWCAALGDRSFDMIVSNPPYIEADDPHLGQGDLRHEPPGALASGADGLDAIRRIVHDARTHLVAGGWLLLEHGWTQGAAVRALLHDHGYIDIATAPDLESRDRVTRCRRA